MTSFIETYFFTFPANLNALYAKTQAIMTPNPLIHTGTLKPARTIVHPANNLIKWSNPIREKIVPVTVRYCLADNIATYQYYSSSLFCQEF